MIRIGDYVKVSSLPDWVADLPDESKRVFEFCLGRTYPVVDTDSKDDDTLICVLDVSTDVDTKFGGYQNDIRLEAKFLSTSSC
ncbi:MAG: hypothetical protein AAFR81_10400 [Chloroflexota bacterium]